MSSLLSAELSATCNALGTYDKRTGKYLIDDFTLNTVKDLIRYLRRDGEDYEIRRHFCQTKVLQTDLLPMLIDHWENTELFDVTLRLLVNLTNPALLLYREEVPVERTARHNYLQILTHLQIYKEEAFTKVETCTLFAKKLAKILEILVDLVETVHLFLKMLEHYCKKTGLVVLKKVRNKTKSKKRKPSQAHKKPTVEPSIPEWEEVRAQLAPVLSSGEQEYPPPFDAASDPSKSLIRTQKPAAN